MLRLIVLVFLLGGLICLQASHSQEKKDDSKKAEPVEKLKGFLPPNYGKLGLSTEQKQKIYKILNDTKAILKDLEAKKSKAKADEKEAMEKLLSAEQLKKLRELRTGEVKDK